MSILLYWRVNLSDKLSRRIAGPPSRVFYRHDRINDYRTVRILLFRICFFPGSNCAIAAEVDSQTFLISFFSNHHDVDTYLIFRILSPPLPIMDLFLIFFRNFREACNHTWPCELWPTRPPMFHIRSEKYAKAKPWLGSLERNFCTGKLWCCNLLSLLLSRPLWTTRPSDKMTSYYSLLIKYNFPVIRAIIIFGVSW